MWLNYLKLHMHVFNYRFIYYQFHQRDKKAERTHVCTAFFSCILSCPCFFLGFMLGHVTYNLPLWYYLLSSSAGHPQNTSPFLFYNIIFILNVLVRQSTLIVSYLFSSLQYIFKMHFKWTQQLAVEVTVEEWIKE